MSSSQASCQQRLGLVIGRFQPFHKGHEAMCRAALADCDRLLVILGSTQAAPTTKNPWTEAEREALIRASLSDVPEQRLLFAGVPDVFYNEDYWLHLVAEAVQQHADGAQVCLYGHSKDSSSYYLALFPQWRYVELPNYENGLSATPLRDELLAAGEHAPELLDGSLESFLPEAARALLSEQLNTASFQNLCAEFDMISGYKQAWSSAPYPPIFVTVDALVQHQDAVLLIQRGQRPGKDLWALPGGFLDVGERLQTGAERELLEETGLDLAQQPHQLLATRPYDAPDRSARGRFVTHLFHYQLESVQRPDVRGGDDAAVARWWRYEDIDPRQMFEDHYCVLMHALNAYPEF